VEVVILIGVVGALFLLGLMVDERPDDSNDDDE
jgi:hypothetical protein